MRPARELLLKVYEHEAGVETAPGEKLFRIVALCSFVLFGSIGLYLRTHNPPRQVLEEKIARSRRVSFIIEEARKPEMTIEKAARAPEPAKTASVNIEKKEPETASREPVDLTDRPVLDQATEDTKPDNTAAETGQLVRRVYGLRKVYSTGIGADGDAADAVVGKLGNTLNTDIDTVTATEEELKGKIAPVTTVHAMPRFKVRIKPEYSKAMIENGIQGVIMARLLVDTDGKVKKVSILDDLGYGSKQKVYEACWKLVFEPATLRDGTPVAVWLNVPFRFELTP
ncbi:MAG: energy transducer TonB [Chitinispirillaceae bacterium]|nr:energy transducer TonB [Chitinispirillaceae bacterium]